MGGPSASPSLTASAAGPISMAAATSIIDRSIRQPWPAGSSMAMAQLMPVYMPLNMSTGQLVDRRGEPSSSPLSSAKPDSHWAMVSMQTRSSCWP
ncbi:Uncharacterised protein [Bordetella pertussis]|nr:Uncharacterised protein [Bordetella pertussis]CPI47548.1 Uncharacterised protein [Bordetella pertussis]CPO99159.1 Uncharacterised protein [Bordetella pertussis]CPP60238.1 Uncharacterised protein [Bordetella pertussis]CRE28129.1 Uncharacterised protein [Bordetella pertussis]